MWTGATLDPARSSGGVTGWKSATHDDVTDDDVTDDDAAVYDVIMMT